jgi:hypothetical protein
MPDYLFLDSPKLRKFLHFKLTMGPYIIASVLPTGLETLTHLLCSPSQEK